MQVIQCDAKWADQILAIFNDAIANTTALYDYHARTMDSMHAWFDDKRKGNYPIIGVVNEAGRLMGFGTYGVFRVRPAYKYTVEHSLYVDAQFRGQGVGKLLMREIIAAAQGQNYHVLVGGVDSQNAVSIALHKQFGFTHCGTIRQAGFKFGRWLDLDFYQLILKTPEKPVDG
ncbi:MAG TPA: GNAT family N-acetyltransferase [Pirellulales bacterium]|nr:GNAT family N-acetyltransferase [Pirellulales bacterium]